jgi:hypothetical protein
MLRNFCFKLIHIIKNKTMKIISFSTLLLLILQLSTISAQPSISWQKSIGGSAHEYTCKTIPTADGGMAFVGFSESTDGDVTGNHGGVDLWVGKLNSGGTLEWSFLYGGTQNDQGYDIIQTADNGYMVTGWTESSDGDVSGHHGTSSSDVWVLKLTSAGILSWAKCYGGDSDDDGAAIAKTQDGNFVIAGSTYSTNGDISGLHGGSSSDIWVIKIDASGTLLSQLCIGGTDYEEGMNLAITADNGCIICGRSSSSDGDAIGAHGGSDMLIAKLNSSFVVEWSKCYGGTETEEANAIVQLTDGSFVTLGYTSTQNNGDVTGHHGSQGSDDFWLLKLTSTGAITWAKCYGGSGDDQANGLTKSNDGGFVICGLTNSMDGDVTGFHSAMFDPDVWVAKLDASGLLGWQRCCGGSGQDESFNVCELTNGVFAVTAFSYSNDYDVSGNHGNADGWIFKINSTTSINDLVSDQNISIYPNPNNGIFTIASDEQISTIEIVDVFGKTVYSLSPTSLQLEIRIPNQPRGIYFCKIINEKSEVLKVMKIIIN